jgi:hypothetical protein
MPAVGGVRGVCRPYAARWLRQALPSGCFFGRLVWQDSCRLPRVVGHSGPLRSSASGERSSSAVAIASPSTALGRSWAVFLVVVVPGHRKNGADIFAASKLYQDLSASAVRLSVAPGSRGG